MPRNLLTIPSVVPVNVAESSTTVGNIALVSSRTGDALAVDANKGMRIQHRKEDATI